MQCPSPKCGETDLSPKFRFCPECGSPLPRAQNVPSKIEHGGSSAQTLLQQSGLSARENSVHGVAGKTQIQDKLCWSYAWLSIF